MIEELRLSYENVNGPARVIFEALNDKLIGNTSKEQIIPEGASASDYALAVASELIAGLTESGKYYNLASFYPPTANPREVEEKAKRAAKDKEDKETRDKIDEVPRLRNRLAQLENRPFISPQPSITNLELISFDTKITGVVALRNAVQAANNEVRIKLNELIEAFNKMQSQSDL